MGTIAAFVLASLATMSVWLALVMSGRKPLKFTIGSKKDADTLWAQVESFISNSHARQNAKITSGDGWSEHVIGTGGKPLIMQFRKIDVQQDRCKASWMRSGYGAIAENKPWMWEMTMVEATPDGGSRLTLAAGGAVSLIALISLAAVYRRLRALCKVSVSPHGAAARASLFASKAMNARARTTRGAWINPENRNDLITSLIACASFIALWGWEAGIMLIPIILLHEYGHVLAYQLTGKTGNRMMLVPFFGGIAIASEPHKNEFERAFCAIMGTAICLPLSAALTLGAYLFSYSEAGWWMTYGAFLCAAMNAANLLPLLPLDGGHSAESLARSIAPQAAGPAVAALTIGGAIILAKAGYEDWAFMIAAWGFPSIIRSMNGIYHHVPPMDSKSGTMIAAFHIGTFAVHAALAWYVWTYLY